MHFRRICCRNFGCWQQPVASLLVPSPFAPNKQSNCVSWFRLQSKCIDSKCVHLRCRFKHFHRERCRRHGHLVNWRKEWRENYFLFLDLSQGRPGDQVLQVFSNFCSTLNTASLCPSYILPLTSESKRNPFSWAEWRGKPARGWCSCVQLRRGMRTVLLPPSTFATASALLQRQSEWKREREGEREREREREREEVNLWAQASAYTRLAVRQQNTSSSSSNINPRVSCPCKNVNVNSAQCEWILKKYKSILIWASHRSSHNWFTTVSSQCTRLQ